MHEGRMIFTGSVQEIQRRIRPDDFTLELEGEPDNVNRLVREVAALEGISARACAARAVIVRIDDDHSRSRALADVLQRVDACDLTLQAIHSGHNATENAYLQLLQEDEAHGFQR